MVDHLTLKRISDDLNQNHIVWGVGGSCLLQLYNLYLEPNDLDLWVQPCDMYKIREIFKDYEEIPTEIPVPEEFHYKIKYDNLEVDFIACFITKPNQYKFEYSINPANIKMVVLDDIKIPCTYLEDWYIIYRLLNRNDKANLIQETFKRQKLELNMQAIEDAINSKQVKIPIRIKTDVYKLIDLATQTSLFECGD